MKKHVIIFSICLLIITLAGGMIFSVNHALAHETGEEHGEETANTETDHHATQKSNAPGSPQWWGLLIVSAGMMTALGFGVNKFLKVKA